MPRKKCSLIIISSGNVCILFSKLWYKNITEHINRNAFGLFISTKENTIAEDKAVCVSNKLLKWSYKYIKGISNLLASVCKVFKGSDKVFIGSENVVSGSGKVVRGSGKVVRVSDNVVGGAGKVVRGSEKVVGGSEKVVRGSRNLIMGSGKVVGSAFKVLVFFSSVSVRDSASCLWKCFWYLGKVLGPPKGDPELTKNYMLGPIHLHNPFIDLSRGDTLLIGEEPNLLIQKLFSIFCWSQPDFFFEES